MKIGILGTGMVGDALATKLIDLGHEVMMGSRTSGNEKSLLWVKRNGPRASEGTFAQAAAFGELIFNCTAGMRSLDALKAAGAQNLAGKILIDVSNPLDFSKGMPPSLSVCNTDSLAEEIQRTFPATKVVKSLNTMNAQVMVKPSLVPGEHCVFVAGNDPDAKAAVTRLLQEGFGWQKVVDAGDITAARGLEMILPLWMQLLGKFQSPRFNFNIAKA